MKNDIKIPTNPAYWVERQQISEIALVKLLTVVTMSLPKSETPKMLEILEFLKSSHANILKRYDEN